LRRYNHTGIPTDIPRAGEVYLERYDLFCTDHESNAYGIQWMRYGPDSALPELVKSVAHVAFEVDDLASELAGREVVIEPNSPSDGVLVAFVLEDGAPVELMQFDRSFRAIPSEYKADFAGIEWSSPMEGVRHKFVDQGDRRLRLVEYSQTMPPHWCSRGHIGYMLEGEIDIEYATASVTYRPGDGILIPDGPAHSHRARAVTDHVVVVFIESAKETHGV
jgi:hypothetical protein